MPTPISILKARADAGNERPADLPADLPINILAILRRRLAGWRTALRAVRGRRVQDIARKGLSAID